MPESDIEELEEEIETIKRHQKSEKEPQLKISDISVVGVAIGDLEKPILQFAKI